MSSEENYSINAAAKLTGYSVPTIRKRLPALKKVGAIQRDGSWNIPLSALHKVGLMVKVEGGNVSSKGKDDEVETLRRENTELKTRAAVAEAVAHERGEALADLRNAMKQLEGRAPTKRSWFSR
jgi:DeoR/GlpR family transcriptional regulator of sugar metabolism